MTWVEGGFEAGRDKTNNWMRCRYFAGKCRWLFVPAILMIPQPWSFTAGYQGPISLLCFAYVH